MVYQFMRADGVKIDRFIKFEDFIQLPSKETAARAQAVSNAAATADPQRQQESSQRAAAGPSASTGRRRASAGPSPQPPHPTADDARAYLTRVASSDAASDPYLTVPLCIALWWIDPGRQGPVSEAIWSSRAGIDLETTSTAVPSSPSTTS